MSSAPFNISSLVADSHMNVASSFGRQGSSSSSSKSDYNQWESILNLVKDKNMKEKQAMSSMTDFVKSYELLFEHVSFSSLFSSCCICFFCAQYSFCIISININMLVRSTSNKKQDIREGVGKESITAFDE